MDAGPFARNSLPHDENLDNNRRVLTRPRLLALCALLLTPPASLAAAYFQVPLDTSEPPFARAALSMGYQLDVTASQGDTHHYRNLKTGWEAKVELSNGRVTSYTVSAPYDAKYPAAARELKRIMGTPWREGDEKMAWLVPSQAITTFKQSWLHFEIKTVSLASAEGRDLKDTASQWSFKATTSKPATPQPRDTGSTSAVSSAQRVREAQQAAQKAEQQRRATEGPFTSTQVSLMCAERIRSLDSNVRSTVFSMDDQPRRMRMYKLANWKYLPRMWVVGPSGKYKQRYECIVQDNGEISVDTLSY